MKKITFLLSFVGFASFAQVQEPVGKLSPNSEAKVQNKVETAVVAPEKKQAPANDGIIVKSVVVKDGKAKVTSEKKVVLVPKAKKKKVIKK